MSLIYPSTTPQESCEVYYENWFSFLCKQNKFSDEKLCMEPHVHTEVQSNPEMAYCSITLYCKKVLIDKGL